MERSGRLSGGWVGLITCLGVAAGCGGAPDLRDLWSKIDVGHGGPDLVPPPAVCQAHRRDAVLPPIDDACENGVCWLNPRPSGDYWDAVGASSLDDVWVGGGGPNSLHYDGQRWTFVKNGLLSTNGYWAFSPHDVWAADASVISHGDGTSFMLAEVPAGSATTGRFWGSAPDDFYVAGLPTLHWDGRAWTSVAGVNGFYVSGSAADDVWVAGPDGVWHFDGSAWAQIPAPDFYTMDIASAGRGKLWMLSMKEAANYVLLFDGTSWSQNYYLAPSQRVFLNRLVSSGPDWALAVGGRYPEGGGTAAGFAVRSSGGAWAELAVANSPGLVAAWIDASGAGYLVGTGGTVLKVDQGGTVTAVNQGTVAPLSGVWAQSKRDLWAVGRAGLALHWDGCQMTPVSTGATANLNDSWGTSPRDVWTVGDAGTILHWDGAAWRTIASGTSANLLAVWTVWPGQAWVGGQGATLLHVTTRESGAAAGTGDAVEPIAVDFLDPTRQAIADIHGTGPNDIWIAGGTPGFAVHFDGHSWSTGGAAPPALDTSNLPVERIWAWAPDDVWVQIYGVPHESPIRHFDGSQWTVWQGVLPDAGRVISVPGVMNNGDTARNSFAFAPDDLRWVGDYGLVVESAPK